MEKIVSLTDAGEGFGGKAKHLAALLAGGFDDPAGFAIAPDAPLNDVRAHLAALGDGAVAVRSSSTRCSRDPTAGRLTTRTA